MVKLKGKPALFFSARVGLNAGTNVLGASKRPGSGVRESERKFERVERLPKSEV